MSLVPPGAKPTMMRTGRDGWVWAQAKREATRSAVAPAVKCKNSRRARFTAMLHELEHAHSPSRVSKNGANVRYWHKADISRLSSDVRFWR
jgi:hypothetical protein